jgi:hypothetical protein
MKFKSLRGKSSDEKKKINGKNPIFTGSVQAECETFFKSCERQLERVVKIWCRVA